MYVLKYIILLLVYLIVYYLSVITLPLCIPLHTLCWSLTLDWIIVAKGKLLVSTEYPHTVMIELCTDVLHGYYKVVTLYRMCLFSSGADRLPYMHVKCIDHRYKEDMSVWVLFSLSDSSYSVCGCGRSSVSMY